MIQELAIDDPKVKDMYEEFVEDFDPSPQYAYDDYASLPDFDTWYHFIYSHYFNSMLHIHQFDSLPSCKDDDIDESFYLWCIENDEQYEVNKPGIDYPDAFKVYYTTHCM